MILFKKQKVMDTLHREQGRTSSILKRTDTKLISSNEIPKLIQENKFTVTYEKVTSYERTFRKSIGCLENLGMREQ